MCGDSFCLIAFITVASLHLGTDVTEFDIMKIVVEFTPYSDVHYPIPHDIDGAVFYCLLLRPLNVGHSWLQSA